MSPAYFDIHAHTHFAAFDNDRESVILRAQEAGVGMVNVGTQQVKSREAVELAHKHPEFCWATVGLHPIHTSKSYHDVQELGAGEDAKGFVSRGEVFDYDFYKTLALDPKVVGIGECGLDYYRLEEDTKQVQLEALEAQIALANEVGKPLMLHIRNGRGAGGGAAYDDAYEIVKAQAKVKGNVHFFAGDWPTAEKFLNLGFTLSFTGVLTFTHDYDEVVQRIPLDMIMTETDCPYIAPTPYRGKRNEPAYVVEIVKKIAEIKGLDFEVTRVALRENAHRVWNIR